MKSWEHFDYEERDEVATLTFSRPDRLNSLTFDVYADIRDLRIRSGIDRTYRADPRSESAPSRLAGKRHK
jgi:enoyl-CoA hydratase/carnithine racemase